MKLRAEQLARHLDAGRLAPIYVIAGDEPLQAGECLDLLAAAARKQGFVSREVFTAGGAFDWDALRAEFDSLSLFAERRVIDLRLPDGKPGDAGAALLREYAARPAEDILLVVSVHGGDKRARWLRALAEAGALVEVFQVAAGELPRWLGRRAAALGLRLSGEAAALLAERAEGNLLAASQELAKLALTAAGADVGLAEVHAAVSDNARFNPFELADRALAGDSARVVRILRGLREEGVAVQLVAWALLRDLRDLTPVAHDVAAGRSAQAALETHQIWPKQRRGSMSAALGRHRGAAWLRLLALGFETDAVVKGAPGSPWDALETLALAICGVRLPTATL